MTTLDFELEIGPGAAGSYPVMARAPGGEAASTLRWSVTRAELDHQLAVIKDKVLVSSAVVRRASTEDEQPVRELGQRLFDASGALPPGAGTPPATAGRGTAADPGHGRPPR